MADDTGWRQRVRRFTDKCRERARYSCWMEMNGAEYICHPMHVHTHAYICTRNTRVPTLLLLIPEAHKQTRTTIYSPPVICRSSPRARGFVWIRCNFNAQICLVVYLRLRLQRSVWYDRNFQSNNNKYDATSESAPTQTSPRPTASRTTLVSV